MIQHNTCKLVGMALGFGSILGCLLWTIDQSILSMPMNIGDQYVPVGNNAFNAALLGA